MRLLLALMLLAATAVAAPPPALTPPDAAVLAEARTLVAQMRASERGPYSRIRWFCNDGTVQPPVAFACSAHGGGRQHGEYSADRARLAALGWSVGTVLAALAWEEVWRPDARHSRLRELPLEHYLIGVDDGWVLHRARYYRGRVQIEDEERAGRALLLRLFAQPGWLTENRLLARELARVLPHGSTGDDRTRKVRQFAQQLAEADPGFSPLRIEIHSRPDTGSAERVRRWTAARPNLPGPLRAQATQLADDLDALLGESGRRARLELALNRLPADDRSLVTALQQAQAAAGLERIERLAEVLLGLGERLGQADPDGDLTRIDLLLDLETELRIAALEWLGEPLQTRRDGVRLARALLAASRGAGLLSTTEQASLDPTLAALLDAPSITTARYAASVRRIALTAGWAAQTVRFVFAEPLVRYGALDPRASRFVDELLRGSVMLPFGELAALLARDAAGLADLGHRLFGEDALGALGINPGVARGRLRIVDGDGPFDPPLATDEVVVLPQTTTELTPVAGILTLGEGNPLSHVQLLARNLGIPNVALPPALIERLRPHAGEAVLLAVAGDGRALLEREADLPAALQRRAAPASEIATTDAPRPDLSATRPLPLAELHAGLSGRVVGPKAANVGQLARLFPDRISSAVAVPFGIFARHTTTQRARVADAYARQRAGALDRPGLERELDAVRAEVLALTLDEETFGALNTAMDAAFTPGAGLFIRSDTNVEDLPGFTGAGLNETLPNVVGRANQLAGIPRVWASVYARRAMAWRARALTRPEEVYASVLLMQSVPSEKSGVMVTRDLSPDGGDHGLTVSVAWGVGGAVDNESAASFVLRPDGSTLRLAEAKAPWQRLLDPHGGVVWRPARSGPVVTGAEQAELRRLAREVEERYPPMLDHDGRPLPWDIEFAFANDRLWLLQIRPLVQRGRDAADRTVATLLPSARTVGELSLDRPPGGQ